MIAFYTELYTGTLMIDDRFKLCVKIQLPAHKKQTPRHLQRPFTWSFSMPATVQYTDI